MNQETKVRGFPQGFPIDIEDFQFESKPNGTIHLQFTGKLFYDIYFSGPIALLFIVVGFLIPFPANLLFICFGLVGMFAVITRLDIEIDTAKRKITTTFLAFGFVTQIREVSFSDKSRFGLKEFFDDSDYLVLTDGEQYHELLCIRNPNDFAKVVKAMNEGVDHNSGTLIC